MRNTHYQTRHPRGSTPHQEMQQGLDRWVRGLRSIEQDPKGSQRRDGRGESTTREPGPRQARSTDSTGRAEGAQAGRQWDEKGRWDDDGGVSA
jgi:hypothetical protein